MLRTRSPWVSARRAWANIGSITGRAPGRGRPAPSAGRQSRTRGSRRWANGARKPGCGLHPRIGRFAVMGKEQPQVLVWDAQQVAGPSSVSRLPDKASPPGTGPARHGWKWRRGVELLFGAEFPVVEKLHQHASHGLAVDVAGDGGLEGVRAMAPGCVVAIVTLESFKSNNEAERRRRDERCGAGRKRAAWARFSLPQVGGVRPWRLHHHGLGLAFGAGRWCPGCKPSRRWSAAGSAAISASSAATITTMPTPQLNTRYISLGVHVAGVLQPLEQVGHLPRVLLQHGGEVVGQHAGTFSSRPPPVMWPCPSRGRRAFSISASSDFT